MCKRVPSRPRMKLFGVLVSHRVVRCDVGHKSRTTHYNGHTHCSAWALGPSPALFCARACMLVKAGRPRGSYIYHICIRDFSYMHTRLLLRRVGQGIYTSAARRVCRLTVEVNSLVSTRNYHTTVTGAHKITLGLRRNTFVSMQQCIYHLLVSEFYFTTYSSDGPTEGK